MMISSFVAYHPADQMFFDELKRHLEAASVCLIRHAGKIPDGEHEEASLRRLMADSRLLVLLISADFVGCRQDHIARALYHDGYPVFPILVRDVSLAHTPWGELHPIAGGVDAVIKGGRARRDKKWTQIVEKIREKLQQLIDSSALQDGLPSNDLRQRKIKEISKRGQKQSPIKFVQELERELGQLPVLRCTADVRYELWALLITYVSHRNPNECLEERLRAQNKSYFEQMNQLNARSGEPPAPVPKHFCPEDPLTMVLDALQDVHAAAQWLYLGVAYVGPTLSFPGSFSGTKVYDLIKKIESPVYAPYLTEDQIQRLHVIEMLARTDCLGLLNGIRQLSEGTTQELERTTNLLCAFRSGQTLPYSLDEQIGFAQSAAALSVLGALSMWQGKLDSASQAYGHALERAKQERLRVPEWVATEALLTLERWRSSPWIGARKADDSSAETLEENRHALLRDTQVQFVSQQVEGRLSASRRSLTRTLCNGLANRSGELYERPVQGVFTEELQELVADQEELGCPPMMTGAAVVLLGTIQLLEGTIAKGQRIADAVALLIRYGASGIDPEFEFFSPALYPGSVALSLTWKVVLGTSRTTSEWLARLKFLKRHAYKLPTMLLPAARNLLIGALHALRRPDSDGYPYVSGSHFGSSAAWPKLVDAVGLLLDFVAISPDGPAWITRLLRTEQEEVQRYILENLSRLPWQHWSELSIVSKEILTQLAESLVALLNAAHCQSLYATGRSTVALFHREHHIPLGLVQVLKALRRSKVPTAVWRPLHRQLCRALDAGIQRFSDLFRETFLSPDVFTWLCAHRDAETIRYLAQNFDRIAALLEGPRTDSSYFNTFALMAELLPKFGIDQRDRFGRLIVKKRGVLLDSAVTRDYAANSLASLAAALLKDKSLSAQTELNQLAIDLLRSLPAKPSILVPFASALKKLPPALDDAIRSAVGHTLEGNVLTPMPWFSPPAEVLLRSNRQYAGSETQESLVCAGLSAVQSLLVEHEQGKFQRELSAWLEFVLLHCSSASPNIACMALQTLESALTNAPRSIDRRRSARVLRSALVRPEVEVQGQAIFAAVKHLRKLSCQPEGRELEAALQTLEASPTVLTSWTTQVARRILPLPRNL